MAMKVNKPDLSPVLKAMADSVSVSSPVVWDKNEENQLRLAILTATRESKYVPKAVDRKKSKQVKQATPKPVVQRQKVAMPTPPVKNTTVDDDSGKLAAWLELHTPIRTKVWPINPTKLEKARALESMKQSAASKSAIQILHAVGVTPQKQRRKGNAITKGVEIDEAYSKELIQRHVSRLKAERENANAFALYYLHKASVVGDASSTTEDLSGEIARLEAHINEHWAEACNDEAFHDAVILAEYEIYADHEDNSAPKPVTTEKPASITLKDEVKKPHGSSNVKDWMAYYATRLDGDQVDTDDGNRMTGSMSIESPSANDHLPPWEGDEDQRDMTWPYTNEMCYKDYELSQYLYALAYADYNKTPTPLEIVQRRIKPAAHLDSIRYANWLQTTGQRAIKQREAEERIICSVDTGRGLNIGMQVEPLYQINGVAYDEMVKRLNHTRLSNFMYGDLHNESFKEWSKWVDHTFKHDEPVIEVIVERVKSASDDYALASRLRDKALNKLNWNRYVKSERAIQEQAAAILNVVVQPAPEPEVTTVSQDSPTVHTAEVVPLFKAKEKRIEAVQGLKINLGLRLSTLMSEFTEEELSAVIKFVEKLRASQ